MKSDEKRFQEAKRLFDEGDYEEALDIFQVLSYESNSYETRLKSQNYIGIIYLEMEKFWEAMNEFSNGWSHYKNEIFIYNMNVVGLKLYEASGYQDYKMPIYHLEELDWYEKHHDLENPYKSETYYALALLISKYPYRKDIDSVSYIKKALDLEPDEDRYKEAYKKLLNLYEKSLENENNKIPKEIEDILDRLKAPCKIIKDWKIYEGSIEDDEEKGYYYLFGLNNQSYLNLPKGFERLEVYFDNYDYKCDIKYMSKREPLEDLILEDGHNLPYYDNLKEHFPKEFEVIDRYLENFRLEDEFDTSAKYDNLVEKYLGYPAPEIFIGGHINPMYAQIFDYEDMNFLMQYRTDLDMIFLFNTDEDPNDIKVMIGH